MVKDGAGISLRDTIFGKKSKENIFAGYDIICHLTQDVKKLFRVSGILRTVSTLCKLTIERSVS